VTRLMILAAWGVVRPVRLRPVQPMTDSGQGRGIGGYRATAEGLVCPDGDVVPPAPELLAELVHAAAVRAMVKQATISRARTGSMVPRLIERAHSGQEPLAA
jgi:hypothetical protein